jgi:hypothetical protein
VAGRALGYGGYVVLVGAYYAAARWMGLLPPGTATSWKGALLLTVTLGTLYVVAIALAALAPWRSSSASWTTALRDRVWTRDVAERLGGIFVLGGGVMVMFDVFAAFKPAIPDFHPYSWDAVLAEADRLLHLGRDPWRWLHGLPARDLVTSVLDWVYVQWYLVMVGGILVALVALPFGSRLRFFFGFVALWIAGGTVAGTALASGGPVYFGELAGDPRRFEELLAYLDRAAPIARGLQDRLWQAFVTPGGDFAFEGISAMPSLHVAVAAYFVFWTWRLGPAVRTVTLAYALAILLGSVHLGWHYALDGYAGALLAWACWLAAVRVAPDREAPVETSAPLEEPGASTREEPSGWPER